MATMRAEDVQPRDVVQICMTGITFKHVTEFLVAKGLTVDFIPDMQDEDPDGIPIFMVGISQRLWNEVKDVRTDAGTERPGD